MICVAFVKDSRGQNYLIPIQLCSICYSIQVPDHYGKVKHSIDEMHQIEDIALAEKILKLDNMINGGTIKCQISQ